MKHSFVMKLQLINVESSRYPKPSDLSGWCPPIGLLTMATELKDYDVEVLDTQVDDNIKLDGDVVGLSCGVLSYPDALEMAQEAKEKGATVVMGGPYVSRIARKIDRPYVDHIVIGDGTPTLEKLLKGRYPDRIEQKDIDLRLKPIPDRGLVDLSRYWRNYLGPYDRPTSMVPQMGCVYRELKGCIFCSVGKDFTKRHAYDFWQEYANLESLGVDYVSIQAEDLLGNKAWFDEVHERRPERNVPMEVIARADRLDREYMQKLSDINVKKIFIGVESGSQRMLDRSRKGLTLENIEGAVKLMKEYDIKSKLTFVLGLPGEDNSTLNKTLDFAEHLCKRGDVETIGASIMTPVPGSPAYRLFINRYPKYSRDDVFPIETSKILWVDGFCRTDYKTIEKATNYLRRLTDSFGFAS